MRYAKALCLVLLALGLLFSMGCDGGGDDGGGDGTTTFDVTGRWTGTANNNSGAISTIDVNLTQTGNTVTGDTTTTSVSVGFFACSPGTINGTISGDSISGQITISAAGGGGITNFDGTISPNGNTISGTSDTNGGACDGSVGTFDINRT